MGSRSRKALRAQRTIVKAADLGPEHVGKFISLVWEWEWEDHNETIEGILVSASRLEQYYHSVNIATIEDRPDFVSGYGMWGQEVTVYNEVPEAWQRVATYVNRRKNKKTDS